MNYDLTSQLNIQFNDASAQKAFNKLLKKFGNVPVTIGVNGSKINAELAGVTKNFNRANRAAQDFGDQVVLSGKRFAGYAFASTVLISISNSFAEATSEAIRFGKEVGKLKQTFVNQNIDTDAILAISRAYGITSLKVAETVRILGQVGGELGNFQKAIKVTDSLVKTTLLASFDDLSSTTEAIIALLETFKLTTDDVAQSLEVINLVSKNYAIEANDLTSAIKRVGGVFAATGGTFEELVALITQVRSTTRESADVIATGFKTIFTSLQRPKTIEFFKQLGIELETSTGKFVGNYRAIELINKGLKEANIAAGDIRFAEIVEEIGGIRQSSRVIPLLTDFERIEEILGTAQNAEGQIASDLIKAQETLANKLDVLRQNFLAFINEVISNKSFQSAADLLIKAANAAVELGRALNGINLNGFSVIAPLLLLRTGFTIGKEIRRALPNRLPEIFSGQRLNTGGVVAGSGNRDTVPAMLTPGEYVINKKAAEKFGYGELERINRYAKGGKVYKFAKGGRVPGAGRAKLFEEIQDLEFQLLLEKNQKQRDLLQGQLDAKRQKFDSLPKFNETFVPDEDEAERREASNQAYKERGQYVESKAKSSAQAKRVAKAKKGILEVRDSARSGEPLKDLQEGKQIAEEFAGTLGPIAKVIKEELKEFDNVVNSVDQPRRKKGKASKKKGVTKIELNPESATTYTAQHETAHVADIALGGTNFASEQSGTFQNALSNIIKPSLASELTNAGKTSEEIKYRTENKEIFADTLVKADPNLRKILVSTTDINKGMSDVAKYMEEVRATTGRLPRIFTGVEDKVLEFAKVYNPTNTGTFDPNKVAKKVTGQLIIPEKYSPRKKLELSNTPPDDGNGVNFVRLPRNDQPENALIRRPNSDLIVRPKDPIPPNDPPDPPDRPSVNIALISSLAAITGEITKSYIDQESAAYRVIDSLTQLATTVAIVTGTLASFGINLNIKNLQEKIGPLDFGKLSGLKLPKAGGISGDFLKPLVNRFSLLGKGLSDLLPKLKAMSLLAVGVGIGFSALSSALDTITGYEEARLRAIEKGDVNKAGEFAGKSANQGLATNIGTALASLGALALVVNPLVGGLLILTAIVVKVGAALGLFGDVLNYIRDFGASLGLNKSTQAIVNESRNEAAYKNLEKAIKDSQKSLDSSFNNRGDKSNIFRSQDFQSIIEPLKLAQNTSNAVINDKIRERGALANTGATGKFFDSVGTIVGQESIAETQDRLSKEIETEQNKFKDSAKSVFENNRKAFEELQTSFIDSGGTDFNTFLNTLGDNGKALVELTGESENLRKEFLNQSVILEVQNSKIRSNIRLLIEQEQAQRGLIKVTKELNAFSSEIGAVNRIYSGNSNLSLDTQNDRDLGIIAGFNGAASTSTNQLKDIRKFEDQFSKVIADIDSEGVSKKGIQKTAKDFRSDLSSLIRQADIPQTLKDELETNLNLDFTNAKEMQDAFAEVYNAINKAKGPLEKSINDLAKETEEAVNKFSELASAAGEARRNFLQANFERQQSFNQNLNETNRLGSNFGINDILKERAQFQPGAVQDISALVNERTNLQNKGLTNDPNVLASFNLINEQIKDQTLLNQQSIVVRQQLIESMKEELQLEKARTQAISQTLDVFSLATREEQKRIKREIEVAQLLDSGTKVDQLSKKQKAVVPGALKFLDPSRQENVQQEIRASSYRDLVSRGVLNPNSSVGRNFQSVTATGQTRAERNLQGNIRDQFGIINQAQIQNNTPLQADATNLGERLNLAIEGLNNNKFNDSVNVLSNLLSAPLKIEFPTEFTIDVTNNNDLLRVLNEQVKLEISKAFSAQRNGQQ